MLNTRLRFAFCVPRRRCHCSLRLSSASSSASASAADVIAGVHLRHLVESYSRTNAMHSVLYYFTAVLRDHTRTIPINTSLVRACKAYELVRVQYSRTWTRFLLLSSVLIASHVLSSSCYVYAHVRVLVRDSQCIIGVGTTRHDTTRHGGRGL